MSSSGFLVPGKIGPVALGGAAASSDWWLASGTIALANVLEHVENPAARQLYAGADATGAWTVSFRTNLASLPVAGIQIMAFDSQTGRIGAGILIDGSNGLGVEGLPYNRGLFATGDHIYMICSSGSSIQAYRDNSAIGSAIDSGVNFGGTVRWRSRYIDNSGIWYDWPVAFRAVHVANVALDATQRAALHAAMMALA